MLSKTPACPLCEAPGATFFCQRDDSGLGPRDYFRCPSCALIFLVPAQRLDLAQEKQRYDSHQNVPTDERYLNFLGRLAEPLSQRLGKDAFGLDFGCGPGPAMSHWFSKKGISMENYDPLYFPHKSLLDRTYDFVTCTEAVEHFFNPRREFLLLDKLLKPGGFLGVMTGILENEKIFKDWWYASDPTHVCFYQVKTLEWIAQWREWTLEFPAPTVALFTKKSG